MEGYNSFIKGLNTEYDYVNQPDGTYRRLLNGIRQSNGTIENEKGTSVTTQLSNDYIIIGSALLEDEIIVFSCNNTDTRGEIGILDKKDIYTPLLNLDSFGFRRDHQIDAQARKDFRGHRLIYFTDDLNPMRFMDLDDLPSTIENTELQLSFKLPITKLNSVNTEGSLPTGVYQFVTRLVTETTNKSTFGLPSGVIPIGLGNPTDDSFSGAPPQTTSNKSITVEISNIDTSYKFVEIIMITYTGTGNTFIASVVGLVPIQSSNILFTINSLSQVTEDVELAEVVQEVVIYKTAKAVEQKDGILFFSNLTSNDSEYNFQHIVNGIKSYYTITEIPYSENINLVNSAGIVQDTGGTTSTLDYADPVLAAQSKGYMRDEVYSFAFVPIYKTGKIGRAFHIPANEVTATNANKTSKELGTYISSLHYPEGFGLANNIRHHKMPSLAQEPHVQTRDGKTYIRILGVEFKDINIPDEIKDQLAGYIIARQPRIGDNKSILSQGFGQRLASIFSMPNKFNVMPWAGKFPYVNERTYKGTTNDNEGDNIPTYDNTNYFAFYSPEVIFNKDTLSSGEYIRNVAEMVGTQIIIAQKRTGGPDEYSHSLLTYNHAISPHLPRATELDTSITQRIEGPPSRGSIFDIPEYDIEGTADKIHLSPSEPGFLLIKGKTQQIPVHHELVGGYSEITYWFESDKTSAMSGVVNGSRVSLEQTGDTSETKREIYNIYSPRTQQYGNVFDTEYIYCGHKLFNDTSSDEEIKVFGGDTFVSKLASLSAPIDLRIKDGNNASDGYVGFMFYAMNYIFLESTININYRHNLEPQGVEGEEGFVAGTPPFYPKNKVLFSNNAPLGLLNYSGLLGHSDGYNKQYSFDNTVKTYFPKQLTEINVNEYPNRTIYSEKSVEGEQFDAYRLFLANNYHDIPKNKGEIVDTFVFNNILYIHTTRGLWRTFVNEQTTQASSSGEVYLGNGGLFPMPSKEVITVDGGYAGTQSQWAGCTTPFGRFIIDSSQGKIFLLTDKLNEISDQGMFDFFLENITTIGDNPSLGDGYISVFDYENNRWIFTKREMKLRDTYLSRYKGEFIDTAQFKSTLTPGVSIVKKDGRFQIYNG